MVEMTGEGDERQFSMSVSSTEPYKRYDWWNEKEYYEVLDHRAGGFDDTRLKKGLPILYNHDRDQHLGRAMEFSNDGSKLTVSKFIWSESEFAQCKKKDAMNGALPDTSVGYRLLDDGTQIGTKDGLPVIRFKWEIYEASLVTVPADPSVGVGRDEKTVSHMRSLPHAEISVELEKSIDQPPQKAQTQSTCIKPMSEPVTIDVSKERNEAVAAERQRVAKIRALDTHFREKGLAGRKIDTSKLAEEFIAGEKTEQEFRNAVMEGNFNDVKPVEQFKAAETGAGEKDLRKYSVLRALQGALAVREGRQFDGIEREMSEAALKASGRSTNGVLIPHDVLEFNSRALTTNVFSAAGALVGTDLLGGSLIELYRNKMCVLKMGARTMGGLVGNVAIPRQSGGGTAYWLSESGTVTESGQTVGQLSLTPKRLGAFTKYSRQLLAQSSIDVEGFVRQDLMTILAIARDKAALTGSGASGEPLGIANNTSLSTSVTLANAGTITYAEALRFETNVANNNAAVGRLGYLTTPTVRGGTKATPKFTNTGFPVWENDMVNGYPADATLQITSAATASTVFFGNWDDVILADWAGGIELLVNPYTDDTQALVRVTLHMLCDNGLRHTQSFSLSTN